MGLRIRISQQLRSATIHHHRQRHPYLWHAFDFGMHDAEAVRMRSMLCTMA